MRVLTDDGLFGFLVAPVTGSGMYRFQLIVQGQLVGDAEPCFLESAMGSLGDLHRLDDDRLARAAEDPAAVMAVIDADDAVHDSALLQVAESLDGWKVRGYENKEAVTLLAQRRPSGPEGTAEAILVSVLPLFEYRSIFGIAFDYWTGTRHAKREGSQP